MRQAFAVIANIASFLGAALVFSPSNSAADDAERSNPTAARGAGEETPNSSLSYTPLPGVDEHGAATPGQPIHVASIPESLRKEYRLAPFYKKYTAIVGIPIIGSQNVSDYAFLECAGRSIICSTAERWPTTPCSRARSASGSSPSRSTRWTFPRTSGPT